MKMNIEIGDKLLCKKSYDNFFYENKYYEVVKLHKNFKNVINNKFFYDDYPYAIEFNIGTYNIYFHTKPPKQNEEDYLWDYFYKPSEMRKVKLNKIKNEIETSNNN